MSDYGTPPPPPPGYGSAPQDGFTAQPPPNYLVWAILSTLFCCLPLGVASIVFAAQVNSKFAAGDLTGASESSAKARKFALYSAVVGVVLAILWGIAAAIGLFPLIGSSTSP